MKIPELLSFYRFLNRAICVEFVGYRWIINYKTPHIPRDNDDDDEAGEDGEEVA